MHVGFISTGFTSSFQPVSLSMTRGTKITAIVPPLSHQDLAIIVNGYGDKKHVMGGHFTRNNDSPRPWNLPCYEAIPNINDCLKYPDL